MPGFDAFNTAFSQLFNRQTGVDPVPPGTAEAYAQMLAEARMLVARVTAQREEIARLEAMAEGKAKPARAKIASFVPPLVVLAAFAVMSLIIVPPQKQEVLMIAGFTLHAMWCGRQTGMAWRRFHRASLPALAMEPLRVLYYTSQAGLVLLAARSLSPWPLAPFFCGAFAVAALAAWAGSSGDPVADRIHGELVAARLAARASEQELSRLEQRVRTLQSADLATLSRVAPWPNIEDTE
jgi:hypothetical protein